MQSMIFLVVKKIYQTNLVKMSVVEMRHNSPYLKTSTTNFKSSSDHKYYNEVQMQMHVTKVHKCVFIIWSPEELSVFRNNIVPIVKNYAMVKKFSYLCKAYVYI